ncbi:MAG: recombinase family protein, partial [Rhodoplanes sp.]
DKIAASKRKGLWVGGPIPLGYASVNKKLVVVPEEAATVGLIFERYLALGSIGVLIEDLDRSGIRTKRRLSSTGRPLGGIRFGVGPLAHLLRNRFYVGEVVYRGHVHVGEQDAIVDRDLFEAIQAKLAAGAAARRVRLRGSRALLAGRIFDDRGNRMTPTHANKNGVRYRYYVSHALLQKRNAQAGSVPRVPAPEIEALIVNTLRDRLGSIAEDATPEPGGDRDLIERHVDRIVVKTDAIALHLRDAANGMDQNRRAGDPQHAGAQEPPQAPLSLPWTSGGFAAVKGVLYAPASNATMTAETSGALLAAIAKARGWIADLVAGRAADFADIAQREGKVERHVRFLAPLAFVSPRIVASIFDRSAPADLTVTALARALPFS